MYPSRECVVVIFFLQVFSLFRSIWVTNCTFDYQVKENHAFFMFEKSKMIPRIRWIGDRCNLKTKKDFPTTQSLVLPFFPHPLECNITPFSHFAPPPSQPTTLLPLCGRKKGGFNSVRAWWPVVAGNSWICLHCALCLTLPAMVLPGQRPSDSNCKLKRHLLPRLLH